MNNCGVLDLGYDCVNYVIMCQRIHEVVISDKVIVLVSFCFFGQKLFVF